MFNLLKRYNELLDLASMNPVKQKESLGRVFNRDIVQNDKFCFRDKRIYPIPTDGMDAMEQLFFHLTTHKPDPKLPHREFDAKRSVRLHWIRFHVEEQKQDDMLIFSTVKGSEKRTYIYDKTEKYVIVLEPRPQNVYFLLTAFYVEGKDAERNKFERLYLRRHTEIL